MPKHDMPTFVAAEAMTPEERLDRLVEICKRRRIPLTIGVLHWEFEKAYKRAGNYAKVLNFDDIWYGLPKRDQHMAEKAHIEMAARFCAAIAAGGSGTCTPPGWQDR